MDEHAAWIGDSRSIVFFFRYDCSCIFWAPPSLFLDFGRYRATKNLRETGRSCWLGVSIHTVYSESSAVLPVDACSA